MKGEYCGLQTDYKSMKTTFNQLRLTNTETKGQLQEAREQLALMDVENSKAANRCEVLTQMNSSLEEDRKNLMSQVGGVKLLVVPCFCDCLMFYKKESLYF